MKLGFDATNKNWRDIQLSGENDSHGQKSIEKKRIHLVMFIVVYGFDGVLSLIQFLQEIMWMVCIPVTFWNTIYDHLCAVIFKISLILIVSCYMMVFALTWLPQWLIYFTDGTEKFWSILYAYQIWAHMILTFSRKWNYYLEEFALEQDRQL